MNQNALYARVNNAGRWGADDELGTLNHITAEKRIAAARLVKVGRTVSLSLPLAPLEPPRVGAFLDHTMDYGRSPLATSAGDHIALDVHQPAATHLDHDPQPVGREEREREPVHLVVSIQEVLLLLRNQG